ncbi:50S ribosomal protein L25 [Candidatus Gracilibacteria bacterium]|nr:50S ribosomal protein L25 [Candidatus Gracilibacteria bacterium]
METQESQVLEAQSRDNTVSPSALRRAKQIPAIVYGPGSEPFQVSMEYQMFRRIFREAGESSLIDLKVDGKKDYKVLVHAVQFDPISDEITHIDLLNVRMDHLLTTLIPVELVGVAPAVKDLNGNLTLPRHEIQVRCLPGDLVKSIVIDVSGLKTFQDSIHARDLKVSDKIHIMLDPDATVVTVLPPRKEEEVAVAAVAAVVAAPTGAPAATTGGAVTKAPAAAAKPAAKK